MKQSKLKDLFDYLPKSKIKAGDGLDNGPYPFYTSSGNQTKYLDDCQYEAGCLIFGTGGKASVHFATKRFSTSTDCIAIRPKHNTHIDASYVYQYFKSNMHVLENGFKGAGLKHISKGYLSEIQIPYPESTNDQIRIAFLLGKIEGLIAKRKKGLQQLDELTTSVFLEMFGDPVINENGWDTSEFLTIISNMRNGLSPSKAGVYKGRVYTLSAITGDSFREIYKEDIFSQIHQKYYPTPNDFLLCRGNGNLSLVGKGYFFPSISVDVIFPDTIIAVSIQPDAINRTFFEALWKTKFIRQQIENNARTTNGAHKINQSVIKNIKIIRPPIDLQNQFAVIIKKVESIRPLYQQSLADLECLYGALSQQAFNGELDLSKVSIPEQSTEDVTSVSQREQSIMPTPIVQTIPTIHLPYTGSLLSALENAEGRRTLIVDWLEAYRTQLVNTSFSIQHFIVLAQNRLAELHPDNDLVMGASDYEYIKTWVFEALAAGTLTQVFDDTDNRIELKAAVEQSPI